MKDAKAGQESVMASAPAEEAAKEVAKLSVEKQRDVLIGSIEAYVARHQGNEVLSLDPAFHDMQRAVALVRAQSAG